MNETRVGWDEDSKVSTLPFPPHPDPLPEGEGTFDVGSLDEFPLGQGRAFLIGDRTIAVFRQRDGRLFATDNTCPHRGGPLAEGLVGNGTVICPLHGWKIDLRSGRCHGEAAGVRIYPVRVVNGRIVVNAECGVRNAE
jgi:nitrite reductase (NADH) small subunit